ncbi:MAG: efflux RND transporter permease subunit [Candidatus Pacebacteria bacterium]|nr:efflux RND transporter permease subunit [Candidatus Paceibacterota bacterium]
MYFLKNKIFTYFLLLLSLIVGGYMMNITPKELYPEIKIPVVIVSTPYPGASARDVEDSVTNKLESSLVGGLKNVKEITSSSAEGFSSIVIEFEDSVEITEALIDVQDRVDEKKSELPTDALEPIIKKVNFSDQPIFSVGLSSTEAYNQLYKKSEEIKDILLAISGVSSVDISGIPDREISVLLNPEKLSQFNIDPNQVVAAIRSSERTFPAGSIFLDEREYRIGYDSGIDTASDLNSVVVRTQSDGNNIYVRDLVMFIEDGVATYNTKSRVSTDGGDLTQQAVIFDIKKQEGGNIIDLTNNIKNALSKYKEDRPNEVIDFVIIFDAGRDIDVSLGELVGSGMQTVALILIVMGLMVGLRESIIAATAIPLSFLLTFIGMKFAGISINFVSLFSLILVIGILIDSAIVIVEGIHDFMSDGNTFFDAASKTLAEFSKPLFAGVLTTISIFVPLMTLSGTLGQFIGGIPRVINIVLIMSLVVALIFIPAIAGIMYRFKINDPKWLSDRRNKFFNFVENWYHDFLEKLVRNSRHKRRIVWGILALLISAFMLIGFGLIQSEFFPPDELDKAFINIELKQGTSLDKTNRIISEVEKIIAKQNHVTAFTTTAGSENVFVGNMRGDPHYANIVVNIDEKENGPQVSIDLREALSVIDDYKVQVLIPESGPPVGAPVQIKLTGNDWDSINIAAESVAELVRSIPGARNVESGVDVGLTEIKLHVIRDRLAEYNLTALDVSSLLRTTIYGTEATTLQLDDGDVDVVVKVALNTETRTHRNSNHINYDQIKNIPIQTLKGEVLLGYFVQEKIEQATSVATHIDGHKNRTVTSYVKDGFLPTNIVTKFNEKIVDISLPDGVEYSLAGATDENDKASGELMASLLLGLLMIFGVLIWQFGSLRDVLFIVSVIPLGLIGVLWGLFLFDMTLSFTAMLGFIALVGVVVNDSIILVDVMNKIRVREPQLSKKGVVVKGAGMRLRPVLLTTVTTVLGMIPLLFVSPMWKPFASSMIFGLTFATVLTLVLIPIFYEKWSK